MFIKDMYFFPFIAISKLPVFLTVFYYMLIFACVVDINTTLSIFLTPLYNFGPKQIPFITGHFSLLAAIWAVLKTRQEMKARKSQHEDLEVGSRRS